MDVLALVVGVMIGVVASAIFLLSAVLAVCQRLGQVVDAALEPASRIMNDLRDLTGSSGGRRTLPRESASTQNDNIFIRARELQIVRGDDERCWQWIMENGKEVVELIQVSRLEVKKNISMNSLEAGQEYRASFYIKLTDSAGNLRDLELALELPDGTRKERMVRNLIEIVPRGTWTPIRFAEFTATWHEGDIEVSLTNLNGERKSGLMIAGIIMRRSCQFSLQHYVVSLISIFGFGL